MSPTSRPSRPITRDDARRLREGIRALVRRFALSERADVACCGMTVAQAATLETLASEGTMRLSELGVRLGISPSTLTRNLVRLERRGLVKRTADTTDGRAVRVVLSTAGERAAAEVTRQDEAFVSSVLARLPAGSGEATLDALESLLRAVRDATQACCPGAFEHLMTGIPPAGVADARRPS